MQPFRAPSHLAHGGGRLGIGESRHEKRVSPLAAGGAGLHTTLFQQMADPTIQEGDRLRITHVWTAVLERPCSEA